MTFISIRQNGSRNYERVLFPVQVPGVPGVTGNYGCLFFQLKCQKQHLLYFPWRALNLEAVVLFWPQEEFGSGLQLQGVVAAPHRTAANFV